MKRPDPSVRGVNKKITESNTLHNIKLMREPVRRSIENIGRNWQINIKRFVKFSKENIRKFNLRIY
ncbi:hypothetical protein [Methanosarcina sp. UBA5]|uniref:hypothetical protein n=1 Tax=Methanosarcina sp. UBA5 TaxID=1915593 RepID=UPI0025EAC6C2|nr:hypothetical protein [Methanosarcina sp. UBA5]